MGAKPVLSESIFIKIAADKRRQGCENSTICDKHSLYISGACAQHRKSGACVQHRKSRRSELLSWLPHLSYILVRQSRPVLTTVLFYCLILCHLLLICESCYVFPPEKKDPCEGAVCHYGAICVSTSDGLQARCQCPQQCSNYGDSHGSTAVCGSDGEDYKNWCELTMKACNTMAVIKLRHYGKCDACEGKICEGQKVCRVNNEGQPICTCEADCDKSISNVCGSDGRTYSNVCLLRLAACNTNREISILYTEKCKDDNPCISLTCGPNSDCVIDRMGVATCVCPPPCREKAGQPVCGSDDVTYASTCELRLQACENSALTTVSHPGPCETEDQGPCREITCEYNGTCIVKGGQPYCECPTCKDQYEPVCGTNGINYENECMMRKENCQETKTVRVEHQGLCTNDECDKNKTVCQFYSVCQIEETMSRCVCPSHCKTNSASVCGTDGKTYANECELRVAACKRQENIYLATIGDCELCNGKNCKYGSRCTNGLCVCPQVCPNPQHHKPVCATDGRTYKSECEMQKASCRRNVELEVVKLSPCDDDVVESGSGEGSGDFMACDESACMFGGTCQIDSEGYSKCSCGFSCDAIRSPVCGTDGSTYGNKCELQAAACEQQRHIEVQRMDSCDEMAEVLCDGMDPVFDRSSGHAYQCTSDGKGCPAGSYCHLPFQKCCDEEHMSDIYIHDCTESKYGCCGDGELSAPGPNGTGCPDMCQCNPMGSIQSTCNPSTRQCSCKPGVGGTKCAGCLPGYWGIQLIQTKGNAGCMPCNCHVIGSTRPDCHQMTGRCECRHGFDGLKCNRCKNSKIHIGKYGCPNSLLPPLPTAVPSTTRTRKTTRHIHASKYPSNMTPKKPKSTPKPYTGPYIRIGDLCGKDGCHIRNSHCDQALCKCDEGFIPTLGNTQCSEVKIGPSQETEKEDTDSDTCTVNPCLHGGVCKVDDNLGYRCMCPLGHSGIICKQRSAFTIPSFSGAGFLALQPIGNLSGDFYIHIVFRTMNTDGILLFSSQHDDGTGQYISIAVSNRHVQFRFDSGSGPTLLSHPDPLSVDMYHQVIAKRIGQSAMLIVDGSEPVVTLVLALDLNLDMSGKIYLGYLPERFSFVHEKIGVNIGLVGCIKSLTAGHLTMPTNYDLRYPSQQILDGLDVGSCDRNPCRSIPCQNGGTCAVVNAGIYQCICPEGYKGSNCEGPVDACTNSPCHPSATCSLADRGEIICHCPVGREGQYCDYEKLEEVMVPEFLGDSYIVVPLKENLAQNMEIEVWFLTRSKNGVLLFSSHYLRGMGDFISLNLVNLFVEFRFDLGDGPVVIRSSKAVELDRWHRLHIQRSNREASLTLDRGQPDTGSSKGSLNELQLSGSLYVGGYKNKFDLPMEANITDNFTGAIQRIYINGKLLDSLMDSALEKKDITKFRGKPCQLNPCLNGGVCVPKLEKADCSCPKRYVGKNCGQIAENLETKLPVKFTGSTHLQYFNDISSSSRAQRTNEFQFRLRTHQTSGLVLFQYQGQKVTEDYLALAVVQGHVEFSYNLGEQDQDSLFRLRSTVPVNDGRWHTIYAHSSGDNGLNRHHSRDKQNGRLQVDNVEVSGSVSGRSTQLNTDGMLWLGGKSNLPWGLPVEYYHGFKGCVGDLFISGREIHLFENRTGPGNSIDFCH